VNQAQKPAVLQLSSDLNSRGQRMSNERDTEWPYQARQRFGAQLSLLGRVGFYTQLALLVVPVLFALYVLLLSRGRTAGDIGFANLISLASSLVMIFTTYWFYRYIRLGDKVRDPAQFAPKSKAVTTLWVGLWAGGLGILLSLLLLLVAAWRILYVLLANPQTGMLVAPNPGWGNPSYSISAIDAVSLVANVITLGAELLVLSLTLWLLFRLTWPSKVGVAEATLAH
jgi:uncharacterized protein DUF3611